MSEKSGNGRKTGMRSARAERVKTFKPERKKSARRWFSLDSLMGKALCVLLVVILTLGAFLAPKLINNLYDAGTLMQISYVDMDLNPYAVPYTNFWDKLMAVARARSAGMRLAVLPAEKAADKISDEELVEIVNKEMETARYSMSPLFVESWWDAQTVDNLVSREKHTVYMRAPAGGEEASQEMTPFQVWTLDFEVTGKQDELIVYDGKEEAVLSQFATHRLIVCMDADFYKIVAIAVRGNREKSEKLHGWNMIYAFGAGPDAPASVRKAAALYNDDSYMSETQTYLADEIRQGWVDYWDITVKDFLYQIDSEGTLGAYLIFEDEKAGAQAGYSGEEEAFGMTENSGVAAAAGTEAVSVAGKDTDLDANMLTEVYDAEEEAIARERELKVLEAEGYSDENVRALEEGGIFLETGSRVEWEETDDNIWILKTGCMEFFEMMQF